MARNADHYVDPEALGRLLTGTVPEEELFREDSTAEAFTFFKKDRAIWNRAVQIAKDFLEEHSAVMDANSQQEATRFGSFPRQLPGVPQVRPEAHTTDKVTADAMDVDTPPPKPKPAKKASTPQGKPGKKQANPSPASQPPTAPDNPASSLPSSSSSSSAPNGEADTIQVSTSLLTAPSRSEQKPKKQKTQKKSQQKMLKKEQVAAVDSAVPASAKEGSPEEAKAKADDEGGHSSSTQLDTQEIAQKGKKKAKQARALKEHDEAPSKPQEEEGVPRAVEEDVAPSKKQKKIFKAKAATAAVDDPAPLVSPKASSAPEEAAGAEAKERSEQNKKAGKRFTGALNRELVDLWTNLKNLPTTRPRKTQRAKLAGRGASLKKKA